MSPSKSSGQTARARRREDFWDRLTFMVGCAAVVGIIASIVAVGSQHIMRSSPVVAEAYYKSAAREEPEGRSWSGRQQTEPAQFDIAHSAAPVAKIENKQPSPAAAKLINETLGKVPKAVLLADGIENIEAKRDAISHAVEGFLAAKTVEAKLPFIRDPERVKPLMMDFYSRQPMLEPAWRGLGRVVRVDEPGYRFGYVQALFDGAPAVTLIIEEMDDGGFRVDWECLVRYGEMAWSEFTRLRPTEPKLLRVKGSRAAAPASQSVAGAEWLELRHPEQSGTVLAFFRRDDPQFAPLLDQLNLGKWKDVPLTLHLGYQAGAGPEAADRVAITGVEGKGWLILNSSQHR